MTDGRGNGAGDVWIDLTNSRHNAGGPCSLTAATSLRSFFDAVEAEIHRIDPNHLISSGIQGSGQCGSPNGDCQTPRQPPSIDVGSMHGWWTNLSPLRVTSGKACRSASTRWRP